MTDIKRLLKLIPTCNGVRTIIGVTVITFLFPVFFTIIGEEPGLFFTVAVLLAMCVSMLTMLMFQVELPCFIRMSAYRKRMMIKAPPVLLFVWEFLVWMILACSVWFGSRHFPDYANGTFFAVTVYYLAVSFIYTAYMPWQYKLSGIGTVISMVVFFAAFAVVVFLPMVRLLPYDDAFIASFPNVPPYLTILTAVAGCVLTALCVAATQHILYRYDIRQKYLDRMMK